MGEEDVVTEVSEAVANGTGMPEKTGEALNEKDENGVTKMEEDKKDDEIVGTEQMNLDSEDKVKDAMKEKEDNSNDAEVVPGPEKEEKLESAKIEEPKAEKEVERDENKPEAMEEEIDSKENAEPEEKNEIEKNEEKKVDEPKEEEKVDEPKEEEVIADEPKEEEAIADKPKEEAIADEPKEEEMVDEPKEEEEMIDEPKEEMVDEPKEGEEEEEVEKEDSKGSKKRGKGKSGGQKDIVKDVEDKREPDQKTPFVDRPVRERKSVERLVASVEREYTREFHIEKGPGTALKDIPNVAFKLSRKKTDETFKLLHPILFGRRGKATEIKSNISRFSGFVWRENEEKQKLKVKEKFDKLNKEKLVEICDVLDVPVAKATTRKEDIVSKLMEFLVEPHATTSVLLSEKDKPIKGQKRKRGVKQSSSTSASTPSKRSAKKLKKDEDTLEEKRSASDSEDESEEEKEEQENGAAEKSDHEMPEPSESEEKSESEEDSEKDVGKQKRKRSSNKSTRNKEPAAKSRSKKTAVAKKSSPAPKKSPNKAVSKRSKTDDNSDPSPKVFSRKKKTENVAKDKSPVATKPASKEKTGKKVAKGKEKTKGENLKPTDDELRDAITEILKEVDFNTATFTDILKKLAKRFDTELTPRKSSIKVMIQDELTKLADEGDDEEEEDDDAEKDETKTGGEGVVA